MNTKFDQYVKSLTESLLTEAPIAMDTPEETESIIDKIVDNIMASKNTTGHWVKVFTSKKLSKGIIADKTDEEVRAMVKQLVWDVVKIVLPENNNTSNPDITKDDLKSVLKDAIKSVFEVNSTYSDFLSARFANKELLGKVKNVVEKGLSDDLEDAIEVTDEGGELASKSPTSDSEAENEENDVDAEDDEEDEEEGESNESSFSLTEFHPEVEYYFNTLDEMGSGTLDLYPKESLRAKYERLDPLKGIAEKGKEFVRIFSNYGMSARDVKLFVKAGILVPSDDFKAITGDTKGFEKTTDEYMSDYVSGALKDYQGSSSGQRFGSGSTEDIFG